ncbi:MAG: 4-hydroxythreonine-4-phosphate dehydrogenase PdxA [Deltaproteobacteria bacterium]|nr:4-hydroxythreonine-4-phosphate dehydrogenase PdxA [Deltaproteobacteria bacterium]MBN2672952.1 4-hydroxythreonine-4-phosphate dehydrogenase PdxA [Deltaproteobacteria bacterium]
MKPILAISLGDPAGIGPEITAASLRHASHVCHPVLFGHWPTFVKNCHDLSLPTDNICVHSSVKPGETGIQFIPIDGPDAPIVTPGVEAARIQFESLRRAVDAILDGRCDAITTAPVSKAWIDRIQPGFTGHTEYLAERCGMGREDVTMVFTNNELVVGLITTHIPLRDVPDTITRERYVRTLTHVIDIVKRNRPVEVPRIAVAGLNPHAGEDGLLGSEEQNFMLPFCVEHRHFSGALVSDPIPPDAVFRDAFSGKYDGVIAAYHDQALIPLKLGGFGGATNVTAGMPFVRTSPDHGTAYEIAGTGIADPAAMKHAIETAVRLIGPDAKTRHAAPPHIENNAD